MLCESDATSYVLTYGARDQTLPKALDTFRALCAHVGKQTGPVCTNRPPTRRSADVNTARCMLLTAACFFLRGAPQLHGLQIYKLSETVQGRVSVSPANKKIPQSETE